MIASAQHRKEREGLSAGLAAAGMPNVREDLGGQSDRLGAPRRSRGFRHVGTTMLAILGLVFSAHAASSPSSAAPAAQGTDAVRSYQCPMHPWIKSAEPGRCTICGMKLVPSGTAGSTIGEADMVTLLPSMITTIGVESSIVARQPVTRTLRVNGRIDDDDTRHRILSARVPGRIEHLDITYTGQQVAAGAPLATIYSPEILSAERIYIERLKAGEGAFPATERAAARERLLELGLVEPDVVALEKSLTPSAIVTVRAPGAGTVVSKSVYEGQYVKTSDRLFEIADFSSMWFVFEIYEQDVPWVRVGQTVEITTRAVPGETLLGPIAFIDPNFDETTRTTRARVVLSNPHPATKSGEPHALPHRVPAEGRILVESPAVLAAPRSAILDAGLGPIAYVALADGRFEPRKLRLGIRGDAMVEVVDGLKEGEAVVTTGALLIDAQAQLSHAGSGQAPAASPAITRREPGASPPAGAMGSDLGALASVAIDASSALAADDFATYQKLFPLLQAATRLQPALPPLEVGDNLRAARRSFEPWSTAVADLLKPHRDHLGVKIFQCPMTPVLGKGRWVQRSQPLKNPFFGSSMADCGSEVQ